MGTVEPEQPSLYADRPRIYPRAVSGRVRRVKWAVLCLLLGIYYLVPWLRWDRGPGAPDQAVLVDMGHARLFFFWIELWPQEVYFLTGILVLAAIGLFAATSLFGRVWCGFTCPQTVWTDLFMWVERRIEGDRNARMKLDAQPMSARKFRLKAAKHAAWLFIAAATGGAWIMYFVDAPSFVRDIFTGGVSLQAWFFFALFTATTYVLAGFAREQVCTYMCPWPRFQGAMLDDQSYVVTYRPWRGEPRGKAKADNVGDCVDCAACVHVCPTGIDIRDGQQLECIGCGLCVDACNDIMRKLHRPEGLIAFETLSNLAASTAATQSMPACAARVDVGMQARRVPKLIRSRTVLYAAVLGLVTAIMLVAFLMRENVSLSVLRDRAPLFVRLSDGGIRNAYTIKLSNKEREVVRYALVADGPAGLQLVVQSAEQDAQGRPLLTTRPDGITEWRVLLTAPPRLALGQSVPVTFRLMDASGRVAARHESVFLGPER
ncbi:cytochrome c oxidase accessory protein CcoG [Rhodovarius crocodyli]|uniref:Cytochrome c oxidase accessory protein CcoG n=2 Tax=Rhodovarius crocodyli TaxID=1979269 RepID=A0A437MFH3_9PROT|nr:cytochrome c oxidase accessory protein CcoG [Rhodovarius crocodyli]RVT96411.1 cytochrome c oxidase accessory protein CcoG [Rhodovarius crocodyli]